MIGEIEKYTSALAVMHWFVIKVYDKKSASPKLIEFQKWEHLRFELRTKYDWYFKYRAALLQVKYPKYAVETFWGNEPATGKTAEHIKKGYIKAKKAKITELKNKVRKAEQNWNSLFSIQEDVFYKKHMVKIARLEKELAELMK